MPYYYDHFQAANPFTANGVNLELDKLDAVIKDNADEIVVLAGDIAAINLDPSALAVQARLSLSNSLAVSTADVTAGTTLYLHPYGGKTIPLFDGVDWVARVMSGVVSIAIPATTATVYDVYAYWTGAAIALELVAWSSGTARATALTTQDGILVKNGDTTRRYMGSIRTTGVSGQCADSASNRFLWNLYNQVDRFLVVTDDTNQWNYTTAAWRQANGAAANQVNFIIGLAEVLIEAEAVHMHSGGATGATGIGLDSTSTNSAQVRGVGASGFTPIHAKYTGYPAIGYHYLAWLEWGSASSVFYGDANSLAAQGGLSARGKF